MDISLLLFVPSSTSMEPCIYSTQIPLCLPYELIAPICKAQGGLSDIPVVSLFKFFLQATECNCVSLHSLDLFSYICFHIINSILKFAIAQIPSPYFSSDNLMRTSRPGHQTLFYPTLYPLWHFLASIDGSLPLKMLREF